MLLGIRRATVKFDAIWVKILLIAETDLPAGQLLVVPLWLSSE